MKVKFRTNNNGFLSDLNKEAAAYFSTTGSSMTGNSRLYIKSFMLVALFVSTYLVLLTVSMPAWAGVLLCMLLGLNAACIGFNIMHDAGHGSYSQKRWLNNVLGYSLNLLGGSIYIWREKHNISHHSYTNVDGLDDDIDIQPFIRTSNSQPWRWYNRYQHIYALLLYSLGYIAWIFKQDFQKYFTGKVAGRKMKKMSVSQHAIFWITKLIYVFNFFIIPVTVLGWKAIIGYLAFAMTCGLVISIVFQLAHVVETTYFPLLPTGEDHNIESEWAIHQVVTTANFSVQNKLITTMLGGLNFQVEHHLFPRISHVHYPELGKRVRQMCMQHNIRYNEHSTMADAIRSHLRYLKKIGAGA